MQQIYGRTSMPKCLDPSSSAYIVFAIKEKRKCTLFYKSNFIITQAWNLAKIYWHAKNKPRLTFAKNYERKPAYFYLF